MFCQVLLIYKSRLSSSQNYNFRCVKVVWICLCSFFIRLASTYKCHGGEAHSGIYQFYFLSPFYGPSSRSKGTRWDIRTFGGGRLTGAIGYLIRSAISRNCLALLRDMISYDRLPDAHRSAARAVEKHIYNPFRLCRQSIVRISCPTRLHHIPSTQLNFVRLLIPDWMRPRLSINDPNFIL